MTPAKRAKRKQQEPLFRQIDITSVAAWISVRVHHERGTEPTMVSRGNLAVVGRLTEPLRDSDVLEITVHAADETHAAVGTPPSIGFVRQMKPKVIASVFILDVDFDRLCSLAAGGLLKHARITLTPPRYDSAAVLSVSFSTEPEE